MHNEPWMMNETFGDDNNSISFFFVVEDYQGDELKLGLGKQERCSVLLL